MRRLNIKVIKLWHLQFILGNKDPLRFSKLKSEIICVVHRRLTVTPRVNWRQSEQLEAFLGKFKKEVFKGLSCGIDGKDQNKRRIPESVESQ